MTRLIFLVLVVAALALAETVYYAARYVSERRADELKRRLRQVGDASQTGNFLRQHSWARSPAVARFLEGLGLLGSLERLLGQIDSRLTVAKVLVIVGAAAAGGVAVGAVLHNLPLACALGVAGLLVPFVFVVGARSKRSARISAQLPDALEMIARSLKAGYALPATFKLVATECPPPVAIEFARAFEQQQLGVGFEQAVLNMTDRVPRNLDLRLLGLAVVIQKETGGNLVEVLETIASTLRERFSFVSKLRSLTAEGKVSAFILGALPFCVAFLVLVINPAYLTELTHGLGRMFLIGSIVSWALGMLWIRNLLKVEY